MSRPSPQDASSSPLLVARAASKAGLDQPAPDASEPAAPRPRFSAVIPVLNGGDRLLVLLDALHRQDCGGPPLDVLIADSGSSDGAVDAAANAFPSARVFDVPAGRYDHGLVRSALVAAARAPLVALFSQDAVPVANDYLLQLSAAFDDDDVAGVMARQIPRPGADPLVQATLRRWTPPGEPGEPPRVRRRSDPRSWRELSPVQRLELARFDNVASMVRRDRVLDLPFPSRSFGEDLAWGAAAIQRGWALAYAPTALVEHHHEPTFAELFRRNRVAHAQAAAEFGLHAVPSALAGLLALAAGTAGDLEDGGVAWALRGLPRRAAALAGQWLGGRGPSSP